jgi:hypothetical protein
LSIWIPDFTRIPWRDVIALHDHNAIGAFRAKLAEAEDEASGVEAHERPTVIAQIGLRESARELQRHFPQLQGSVFSVGLDLAIGFTPLAPVSAVREIAALQHAHTSWVAIYLTLKPGAPERS